MKEDKATNTESENAEESTSKKTEETTTKKQGGRTANQSKQTNQNSQTNQNGNTNSNSPDWLMHLLTGAGALGGNYLLFIKPLQDKFDAMSSAILQQEKNMEDIQEQLDVLKHKLKKTINHQDEEELEQNNGDLFTVKSKQKQHGTSKPETRRAVRF